MTYIGPEGILAKRKAYFYPCTAHFYKNPPQLVRGSMQYLYDELDQQYVDFFAGVSVVACGHCNEQITTATIKQLQQLQHTTTIYLTQPMVDLSEKMASVLPGKLNRTFFCNSGSEANEGAMLLARLYTGKSGFIALENGLHGRTYLTMAVTGIPMWRADSNLDDVDVSFIPRPYDTKLTPDEAATRSLDALKKVLEEKGDQIAAMIVEPIQGNGGMIVPVPWYFQEVKKLLEQYNVLLISDEIQTGFGRTGKMFAMEHFGIVPDIMSMAKALGNGVPISCFASTDEIASAFTKPSASTFGGNPVSAVTALAVLDYIEQEKLANRAADLGKMLKDHLVELQSKYSSLISDVRGLGLMLGMEMCAEDPAKGAVVVDQVLEIMKDRGFIIGKNGVNRNVIAFQPPLVVTEDDINKMLSALDVAIAALV
ncbi:aspartate aminotransferase family protein [Paenibacillus sp. N1-5-1-14]|uniref:aspartate aminotransferase family protein n=1 Tax=Paenibacillus radicibacter TaxID=2972488 RepID=UPI002158CC70|nr:aspartate aminotransferase family protein [Paenibacillus radicibacter]MCR8645276.1 aspartate aminotransferase family protein [Paenibacillus radicibacter]